MRRLFSFEDTIAQWTMTVFSIVAAYFLWRTLLTTRQMSIAQSRAYVHVSSATVQWVNRLGQYEGLKERDVFSVVLSIENTGHTPARWYEISGDSSVMERNDGAQTLVSKRPARVMRWGILPPNTPLTCPHYAEDISRQFVEAGQTPARIIRLDGSVKYETEFNEIRETPFSFYADGLALHDVLIEQDLL